MMRHCFLLACLSALVSLTAAAQAVGQGESVSDTSQVSGKMGDLFKELPDTLAPALTQNNRLDCIDFLAAAMKAEVRNSLGGKSELETLTDQYARLRVSDALEIEMRLLDVEEPVDSCGKIVCLVQTFGTGMRESTIDFYSLAWRHLPTADYICLPSGMLTARLSRHDATLTLSSVTDLERPAMEEQEKVTEWSKKLKWMGGKFK